MFDSLGGDGEWGLEAGQLRDIFDRVVSGFDPDSGPLRAMAAGLLYELARRHRTVGQHYWPELAEALADLAIDLGCFRAAFERLGAVAQGVHGTVPPGQVAEWLESAFALGLSDWDNERAGGGLDGHLRRMLRIVRWRADAGDPGTALRWLGELLVRAEESGQDPAGLFALGKRLADGRAVYVLERVEPSADRVVREIVKNYRPLATVPTPLAGVPDLRELASRLDADFPWFAPLNRRVVRELVARAQGSGAFHLPPMLLVGPPGSGKTSWVRELARLAGVPFVQVGAAGQADNKVLEATARGWSSANPCRPVEAIRQSGRANPMFLLDELDKVGTGSHNGHIWDTLLKFLEPANASRYYDECLGGHCDLSFVSWIATANDAARLPGPLLDRLEVVEVGLPAPAHYPGIVAAARRAYQRRHGLMDAAMPEFGPAEWAWLRKFFGSPRRVGKATERLLSVLLSQPGPGQRLH